MGRSLSLVLALVSCWFLNPPPAKYQSTLSSSKESSILGNPSRLKPRLVHRSDVHCTGDLCSCWEAQLSLGPISKGPVVVPSLSQEWCFNQWDLGQNLLYLLLLKQRRCFCSLSCCHGTFLLHLSVNVQWLLLI